MGVITLAQHKRAALWTGRNQLQPSNNGRMPWKRVVLLQRAELETSGRAQGRRSVKGRAHAAPMMSSFLVDSFKREQKWTVRDCFLEARIER